MTKNFKIYLNSKDSNNLSSNSSTIKVAINKQLDAKYMRIYDYCVPVAFNNVVSGVNDTMSITESLNTYTITATIAEGIYDIDDLMLAFQTALNAASVAHGNSYTYTLTDVGSKVKITCSGIFKFNYSLSNVSSLIGYKSDSTVGLNCSGNVYYNMFPNEIYVHCNLISDNYFNNQYAKIIKMLPLDVVFGAKKSSSDEDDYSMMTDNKVNNVEVELRFSDGRLVPMQADWNISLEFIYSLP